VPRVRNMTSREFTGGCYRCCVTFLLNEIRHGPGADAVHIPTFSRAKDSNLTPVVMLAIEREAFPGEPDEECSASLGPPVRRRAFCSPRQRDGTAAGFQRCRDEVCALRGASGAHN